MNKEEVEKIVFKIFFKVSPFKNLIQIDSIKNCKPQKPDIYCLDKNKNEYYFELVEIVDQGMAQSISNLISFPSFFQEQLNKLHSTKQKLFNRINSNASFHFYFKNGVTKAIIRKHFQTIIEELIGLDKKYKGKYEIRSLINIIKYIRIKRYNFNITSFNRVSAGSYGDPKFDLIQSKLKNYYDCNSNTELIAYYDLQESFGFDEPEWITELTTFISGKINSSYFRKVWIFDVTLNKILYVYPN